MRKTPLFVAALALTLVGASTPPPNGRAKVTRVHVKKSARTMDLFAGDSLVASYNVAVGKGGAGPKRMEGDSITPIGRYRVLARNPSHLRIFMRLDYPNKDDRARFDELKKNGQLPKNATIGGDIGIHGAPPEEKPFVKAEYGSHGCVVLENAEIDQVAKMVPDGTVVDIED